MKRVAILVLIVALVSTGFFYFRNLYAGKTTVTVGRAKVNAEIANEPAELTQGLSGRSSLTPGNGMLFVFAETDYHGIWMKDMKFPIDIIWLNENKQVVDVYYGARPDSYPFVFKPIEPAKYVLEVSEGFAQKHQIEPGIEASFDVE